MEQLNPNQQKAATHFKGPLLIIAGAGSGKTKVITSRIAHLVKVHKVPASEILALTFTDKASQEMQERVDLLLPLGSNFTTIKTFHGFCDLVLKESGHEIGLNSAFKKISKTEAEILVKKNITKFQLDYYRPLSNPTKFISDILQHFSRLKDEDISPEEYLAYAEKLPKSSENAAENEEVQKTLELAKFYRQYQDFLLEKGVLDFGDLIFYSLRLLEKRQSVLEKFQNRFTQIMVDEFQDTNFAQSKLVDLLSAKSRNLVVVGDDDQAIYKWRGASLSNILQFQGKYPDCASVVLNENYRSGQKILDFAYSVIRSNDPERLEVRQEINKKLKSNTEFDLPVELHVFQNRGAEVNFVCDKLSELTKEVPLREIAILARTNSLLGPYASELKERGIAFRINQFSEIFKSGLLKDLKNYLYFANNPFEEISLIGFLRFDVFKISNMEIFELINNARKNAASIWLTLKSQAEEKTLPGLERQNFRRFYEIISKALELSGRVSVRALIDHLLKESDFYKSLTQIPEDQANEKVAKLQILLKIIERFENEQDANSVADFLEYLEAVEQSGESFDSEQSDENCVSLLTVHSSKGLEFDTVFMVGLVQEKFPARNKSEPFSVPEALLKENLPESGEKNLQEERRLFYVAATRAKKRLFLSHAQKYSESRKVWKSSIFLSEAAVETYLKFNHESTENEFQFAKPKVEFADLTPPKIIKRFSYSQFEAFSSCPQKYKFRYICKIPTPQSHVLNFGVSIHNALNDFYSAVKQGRAAEIDLLLQMFERNWIKSGYETKDLHDFKKAEGRKMLEAYYEANKENFGQSVFLERPFTVKFGDFTITGRIDRIDKLPDGTYEIIDYKTGNSKKAQDVDKDLQLTLYAIAAKDVFEIPVSALSLYFVKENQKLTTRRKEQDLEKAKSKLQETVNKITQSDFAPTPGLSCKYCDYRNICESAV